MSVRRAQDERLEGTPDGNTAISEIMDVADTPTIGSATNVGTSRGYNNGAATVAVTAAATGGTPTSYTVTSSPGSYTGSGATSPVTVTGLASQTSYTFTATATSAGGTSAATTSSNSITATTVPQAPTIGTAVAGADATTQVSVPFTPGATGGSAVTGYTVTSSPGSITGTGSSSPITVSGLSSDTAYTFTVTATNANGASAASSASNSVTTATPTDFYSIATVYGDGSSVAINLADIPQTYTHLQLRISGTINTGTTNCFMYRVNRTTSSTDYQFHTMYANRTTSNSFSSADGVGTTSYIPTNSRTVQGPINVGGVVNAGAVITDIMDYTSSSKYITFASFAGHVDNTNNSAEASFTSGLRQVVGPVTSIYIFNTGSNSIPTNVRVALYGMKA